jgi:hypothetical protein
MAPPYDYRDPTVHYTQVAVAQWLGYPTIEAYLLACKEVPHVVERRLRWRQRRYRRQP